MSTETIVAVFRTTAEAEAVTADLRAAGIHATAIEQHTADQMRHETVMATESGEKRSGFWSWVLGDDASSDELALYDQKLSAGSVVVSVVVADTDAARVEAIIEKHHPVDIDEHTVAASATAQPAMTAAPATKPAVAMATRAAAATAQGEVIALAEESLNVGKRVVDRGVAKIRRYVVSRPVEEQIRLRTESLRMERRPVTGDAKVGADAFSEKTFEMKQTSEEAVVSKTARVVEEVVLGKDVTERVETVKDTVRREEIEVVDAQGKATVARPAAAAVAPVAPAKTPVPATPR